MNDVVKQETAVNPINNLTKEQVALLTRTICKGATQDELALFVGVAKRVGLDPFTRQLYFVKRYDTKSKTMVGTVQIGIDGYRAIAEKTGTLAGISDATFDDETQTQPGKATVVVKRLMPNGTVAEFEASARWEEYAVKTKEGYLTGLWKKMPYLMLGKCAEALALRKAFPNYLSGIYTTEEMQQADVTEVQAQQKTMAEEADVEVIAEANKKVDEIKVEDMNPFK